MSASAGSTRAGDRRVVVALDKFKGSIDALAAVESVAAAIERHSTSTVVRHPIADGGDGTVGVALSAGWDPVHLVVRGPLGASVPTSYARSGERAIVELARSAGLGLLPGGRPTPATALASSTVGVGETLRHAAARGVRHVTLGLGGSCTTDGGAGMMRALGARMIDGHGDQIGPGGAGLLQLAALDHGAATMLDGVTLTLACDVDNPLVGADGAAAVYAPQKGAGPAEVALLATALEAWADAVAAATDTEHRHAAGAGAGGGTGFAALAMLGATIRPGIDVVLEATRFDDIVDAGSLVIVGEASFDAQSLRGKGPIGVARRAAAAGAAVIAIVGRCELTSAELEANGIAAAYELRSIEPDPAKSMRRAAPLLAAIGEQVVADGWAG